MSGLKLEADVRIENGVVRVGTYDITQRAGELDLVINQGQNFQLIVDWWDEAGNTSRPLTGHTVTLIARAQVGDLLPVVDLTAALQNSDKEAKFAMTGAETADLDFVHALYEIVDTDGGGKKVRLLRGRLSLDLGVS